jgi:hypothetical protein
VAGFDSTAGIRMKGTIYLWVLAAVLAGALVGLVGSQLRAFLVFNLRSWSQ